MSDYKKHFALSSDSVYLNCASQGPIPKITSQALMQSIRDKENPFAMNMQYGAEHSARARNAVAKFIGAKPDQVALSNSTGWAISCVARGLRLGRGDVVVCFEGQFPSNIAPWEHFAREFGFEVKKIPAPGHIATPEALKAVLTSDVKAVCLEWVHFVSGQRIDLQAMTDICQKRDVPVIVDATQGLGAIPFSMKDYSADVVICSAYKWMLSPYGSGYFILSEPMMERLEVSEINWMSLKSTDCGKLADYELELCHTARRFDTFAFSGLLNIDGMTTSTEWLSSLDLPKVYDNTRKLCEQLREELPRGVFKSMNERGREEQSLIESFYCPEVDSAALLDHLTREKLSATIRCDVLRVSPNLYNDAGDISRFTSSVRNFLRA